MVRDKRTLLATIVLPVMLYPLMIIGFSWIRSSEESALKDASYRIAVADERSAALLGNLIADYRDSLSENLPATSTTTGLNPSGESAPNFEVMIEELEDIDIGGVVDARVEFIQLTDGRTGSVEDLGRNKLEAKIVYRRTDVHSDAAASYLKRILDWQFSIRRDRAISIIQREMRDKHPTVDIWAALSPVSVEQRSVSSDAEMGGWLLGQILPIILVVMTISGATYPAIDLTAGERERGTLETLLVTPVPALEVITGKFLVVTTIAMGTAVLNVASMGTTLHLGGMGALLGGGGASTIPLHVFPIVLLCLLPFAILSSAVLLAVCCFARTFKEAQNYVMPILVGSMVPAAVGLMQTMELKGAVLVMPIANLTLLTRDLFQGTWTLSSLVVVLLSTSLYAATAVAIATKLFGQEAVTFSDSFKFKTLLMRKWFPTQSLPNASQVLLPVAVLFPVVFYVQSGLQMRAAGDLMTFMRQWGIVQILLFVGVPVSVLWYLKRDIWQTLSVRLPRARDWVGAVFLGASAWVVASEVAVLQTKVFGVGLEMSGQETIVRKLFSDLGLFQAVLLVAVLPGVCEEFLFRGFLLSGIRRTAGKWGTILVVGVIFGLFHIYGFKLLVTSLLGMLLAFVCWQTGSIWPGILVHVMHNAIAVCLVVEPRFAAMLQLDAGESMSHLPAHILIPGFVTFAGGLLWVIRSRRPAAHLRGTDSELAGGRTFGVSSPTAT